MKRVTDEQVLHMLTWASNFGDVESWERISRRGAKWLVRLAFEGEISTEIAGWVADIRAFAGVLGPRALDVVPHELALTNREVMLLCYGLAVGGWRKQPRSAYRACWDQGESHPDQEAKLQRQRARMYERVREQVARDEADVGPDLGGSPMELGA